jgi:hypothetical protein
MNGFISDSVQANQWLPKGFVGELLPFVLAVWDVFIVPAKVSDEDKITALVRRLLKQHIKNSERHNWMVLREVPIEDEQGGDIGWNDIRVLPPDSRDEDYAFVFECKRLNVTYPGGKFKHNADAYVDEGMMRFVAGQYSTALHEAGMLGYVMDGNTTGAHTRIVRAIRARRAQLQLASQSEYSLCRLLDNKPPHGQTRHTSAKGNEFTLYHLLVPIRRNIQPT